MANAKRILITTESREIFIVRTNGRNNIRGFCETCEQEVQMLTIDEAVSVSGKTTREIMRQIEAGAVHSVETASGHLLVCQNSQQNFWK